MFGNPYGSGFLSSDTRNLARQLEAGNSLPALQSGTQQPMQQAPQQAPQQAQAPQFDPTGMAGFYSGPEATLAQNALSVAMDRGTSALDRAAAASGGVLSGAQAKALSDYAQGTNQQYMQGAYGDYANRLAAMAGIGQTASQSLGNLGSGMSNTMGQYGSNAGNMMMAGGNAAAQGMINAGDSMAAGTLGSANAWGGALNNLGMYGAMGGFNGIGSLFGGGQPAAGLGPVSSADPGWYNMQNDLFG